MSQLVALSRPSLPALVAATGDRAVGEFLAWCESRDITSLPQIQPLHVASWIEGECRELATPTVKQ